MRLFDHCRNSFPSEASPSLRGSLGEVAVAALDNAYDKPIQFAETFLLQPIPGQAGGFFIHNQVLRLVLG
ncbi:hypothetical protein [Kitasatospora sp. NPDC059827]|uniref:hypothetical protein n=1 Tax=Kitasatospora sp. NPDC059827 TaxID=3346964 RepID=UPI0036586C82